MASKTKTSVWLGTLTLLLGISIIVSITIGSVRIPLQQTLGILVDHLPFVTVDQTWTKAQEAIVWNLRLPRIFLAVIIGGMLAAAGVAFQGILRNPLADPYILGVSSGSALGAAVMFLFFPSLGFFGRLTLPLFAFAGGLLSLAFVMLLSQHNGQRERETLILAGVVVQSLVGALLTFLISISGDKLQSIIFWMMGSLANRDWGDVAVLLPYFLAGTLYLLKQYQDLNVIALGERAAAHLGMDVERKKIKILLAASLLTAAAVSLVGIIGFVGLVIPHLMRLLVGPDHKILFPASILAGAIFLLWSDTLARSLLPSREIPIGVITAFIGAPFFAYLLKTRLRRG